VIGIGLYVATLYVVRQSRDLERYRFIMLFVALALLVSPLIPNSARTSTARAVGALRLQNQFQPIEIAKLLLVLFFASYFIEKRELFTIPTRRVGNHLLPDIRAFGRLPSPW